MRPRCASIIHLVPVRSTAACVQMVPTLMDISVLLSCVTVPTARMVETVQLHRIQTSNAGMVFFMDFYIDKYRPVLYLVAADTI